MEEKKANGMKENRRIKDPDRFHGYGWAEH